jgi:hypothetical protein
MNPYAARLLSEARISELRAEGAANHLAAEARRKNQVESPCRAEAGSSHARLELPRTGCSWIERMWTLVRRAMPVRTA